MNQLYQRKINVCEIANDIKKITNISNSSADNYMDAQLQEKLQKASNHLEQAIQSSKPRLAFPAAYKHKFPFNLGAPIRTITLKFFNMLFFDQRKVNKDLAITNQCLIDTLLIINNKLTKEIEECKLELEMLRHKHSDNGNKE